MNLRYGLNPEQRARASLDEPGAPVRVVSGEPSYINLLDALGAWQLVREAATCLSAPVATSFKHLSPAGAAVAGDVDDVMADLWVPAGVELSPIASAYVRARDCDPKSSFGDFVAVSEPVDFALAHILRDVVSDGIVAPAFEPGTVEVLARKKAGRFLVLEADEAFEPPALESRTVFGVRLQQDTAATTLTPATIAAGTATPLSPSAVADLLLAMVTARHTQSNSVAYARDGMVLGVGAGQQSRVDCTKLAGVKVDTWWLRRHEKARSLPFRKDLRRQDRLNWQIRYIEGGLDVDEQRRFRADLSGDPPVLSPGERADWLAALERVALASDGYIPFRDNIDHAARHGVAYIADPGGSSRNEEVETACAQHGIVLATTGVRLFRH
jgi:phosphoribosylaminoimidazolecarboxamide formyltransferase/IMP cyclohydrolase